MDIADIVTARLRFVTITPESLDAETADPKLLEPLLRARVPADWPEANWEPHVFALIKQQFAGSPHTRGWHRYVILRTKEPVLIGALGAFPSGTYEAEIGYGVLEPWQRKGYATEGTRALFGMLFTEGITSVIAHTAKGMQRSIRVMERCGLEYEAQGTEEDTVRYRIRNPSGRGTA